MRKHERIHTDTRPYACQFCHKAFTQRDKMVVHTRLHTGERPYVCEQCGKGFCESGNLKKHMRVHGKEPPHIMHQNNKGKPAPNQAGGVANTNVSCLFVVGIHIYNCIEELHNFVWNTLLHKNLINLMKLFCLNN